MPPLNVVGGVRVRGRIWKAMIQIKHPTSGNKSTEIYLLSAISCKFIMHPWTKIIPPSRSREKKEAFDKHRTSK